MLEEFESKMSSVLQAVASLTTSVAGASSRLHKIEVECWEIDRLLGNPPAADADDGRDPNRDADGERDPNRDADGERDPNRDADGAGSQGDS